VTGADPISTLRMSLREIDSRLSRKLTDMSRMKFFIESCPFHARWPSGPNAAMKYHAIGVLIKESARALVPIRIV